MFFSKLFVNMRTVVVILQGIFRCITLPGDDFFFQARFSQILGVIGYLCCVSAHSSVVLDLCPATDRRPYAAIGLMCWEKKKRINS